MDNWSFSKPDVYAANRIRDGCVQKLSQNPNNLESTLAQIKDADIRESY